MKRMICYIELRTLQVIKKVIAQSRKYNEKHKEEQVQYRTFELFIKENQIREEERKAA